MSLARDQPRTGTTIVACEYDGGVVLGADTRVSTGTPGDARDFETRFQISLTNESALRFDARRRLVNARGRATDVRSIA